MEDFSKVKNPSPSFFTLPSYIPAINVILLLFSELILKHVRKKYSLRHLTAFFCSVLLHFPTKQKESFYFYRNLNSTLNDNFYDFQDPLMPVVIMQLFPPLATGLILTYNHSYSNIYLFKIMSLWFKLGISKQLTAVVQNVHIVMHIHEYFIQ